MSGKVLSWSQRICSLSVYFKIVLLLLLLLLLHTGTEKGKTAEGEDAAKCGTLRSDAIAEDVHKRNLWTLYRCFAIYLMMSAMCENILLCCREKGHSIYLSIYLNKSTDVDLALQNTLLHILFGFCGRLYISQNKTYFSAMSVVIESGNINLRRCKLFVSQNQIRVCFHFSLQLLFFFFFNWNFWASPCLWMSLGLAVNWSHCLLGGLLDIQNSARDLAAFQELWTSLSWSHLCCVENIDLTIQNYHAVARRSQKCASVFLQIQGFPLSCSVRIWSGVWQSMFLIESSIISFMAAETSKVTLWRCLDVIFAQSSSSTDCQVVSPEIQKLS